MPFYYAEALDKSGKTIKGVLDYESEEKLIEELRVRGYYPLNIRLAPKGSIPVPIDSLFKSDRPRPSPEVQRLMQDFSKLRDKVLAGDDQAFQDFRHRLDGLNLYSLSALDKDLINKARICIEPFKNAEEFRRSLEQEIEHTEDLIRRAAESDARAIKELDIPQYACGWLEIAQQQIPGHLSLMIPRLVFLEESPNRTVLHVLCNLQEIIHVKLKGIFSNRLLVDTSSRKKWVIKLNPAKSQFPPKILLRIIKYERAQLMEKT